jgi:protein-disulfide isomerase
MGWAMSHSRTGSIMSSSFGARMVRALAVAAGLFFIQGIQIAVGSMHGFTPQQTETVRQIIRDYLVSNPEVILEAIEVLKTKDQGNTETRARQALSARRAEFFEDPGSPVAGNQQGDVAVIEFFDYRCPYCKRVHPTIQALLRDDRNIKFIYKEWPILGPPSVYAARAALAARNQEKYVEFHAALMDTRGTLDEAVILRTAKSIGLDVDRLTREIEAQTSKYEEIFARNSDLARSLGISGTPAFVVGDVVIRGAADLESLKKVVGDVRRRAPR